MDVWFRELEPYYIVGITSPFGDLPDTGGTRQEGGNGKSSRGSIPISIPYSVEKEDEDEGEKEETRGVRSTAQGELLTYSRRGKEPEVPTVTVPVPSPSSSSAPTHEIPTPPSTLGNIIPTPAPLPAPMSERRTTRSNAGNPPKRYGWDLD